MPLTPEQLLEYLETLGIRTTTIDHIALHTVAESQALRVELPGAYQKPVREGQEEPPVRDLELARNQP